MSRVELMRRLMGTSAAVLALGTAFAALPAHAQDQDLAAPAGMGSIEAAGAVAVDEAEAIVVTGSRIRRSATDTAAPVTAIDMQALTDRGFVSAAQALNQITSNVPSLSQAPGDGDPSGSGQQFPELFGLGAGRTLTLVNGRRFVTSSSGLGDSQVDTNIIPTGLIERVEVVQAGSAAVYGSDAIAGVVNYILRDDFEGIELDGQTSLSSRGDYPVYSLRGTAGTNFAEGRGNIAVNVEWSKSPQLMFSDRRLSGLGRVTVSNSANAGGTDTGDSDGIPAVREVLNTAFWEFNRNGVIFNTPAPVEAFLTRANGSPLQFDGIGNVVPYDPGNILGIPFASGGQGFRYADLVGLRTGVERLTSNVIGHYDLTDNIKLSTELLYARTKGTETPQGQSRTVLNPAASNAGSIAFTRNNPFLTEQAIATLSAARPQFAAGAPLFLSKYFYDLVPANEQTTETETYRALIGVDGDFTVANRDFYWSVSASHGRVEGSLRAWDVINSRFNNAINATRNAAGEIVCAINADATATNDDPNCAPINPFGDGNVSQAARNYVSTLVGTDYVNKQTDLLATIGGSLFQLPGGEVKFSAAYEHRDERASFTPLPANQQGLVGTGAQEFAQSGKYNTDELSGELLVPIVGEDFTLPLVQALELNAAYRFVDNSAAGTESVWNLGLRWEVTDGVTLRGSRGRNFRAPTLSQLYEPRATGLESVGYDPCDADRINSGPNPAVRRANCLALFEANPGYGVRPDGLNAGASAAERLAGFQNPSENFTNALVTTGGNPELRNEVSKTLTYGIVLQPRIIPGLTITADRIEIDLQDGLSPFTTQEFAEACYDNETAPEGVCEAFSRLAAPDGTYMGGMTVTGRTTTFNAGVMKYRGEVYNVNYLVPLDALFGREDLGTLELALEATHNTLLTTSVTGATFTRTDNTVRMPTWRGRFDARYSKGPFRFTYQLVYLDKTRAAADATIENNPHPIIASNTVHNISTQFDIGQLTLRAGINNLFDKEPSYPNISYGDIIGRQFFMGAKVRF